MKLSPAELLALVRGYPLATLVCHGPDGLLANHIPLWTDATLSVLRGHVARANPLWRVLGSGLPALAIFHGPQAYVSPSLYPCKQTNGQVVPTWNYAVLHVHGQLRAVDDRQWVRVLVDSLTAQHEAGRAQPWQLEDAPAAYAERMTGIGETRYCKRAEKAVVGLQLEASLAAIRDAGLDPKDIDGLILIGLVSAIAEDFIDNFGIPDLRFSALTPHGGASPAMALQAATLAVAGGVCNHVLIAFGRNVSAASAKAGARIHQMPQFHYGTEFELASGMAAPAQIYAPMARRHMERYGTTVEHFGEIAVAMLEHAMRNDNAMMRKPMTLADHRNSRMIADPFRLFDCGRRPSAARRCATDQHPWRIIVANQCVGHEPHRRIGPPVAW